MEQETITLYSTHCPRCQILEAKLDKANIGYKVNTDVDCMISKGFLTAPMLDVNGTMMNFAEANNWINERANNN